ncbi:MAG: DNA recombination protein RmuC [Flavobacteriales bacterium]|nr:DNA recombination protein RmuC [Flavobacteriales bacterium]
MEYVLLILGVIVGGLIGFIVAQRKGQEKYSTISAELESTKVENGTLTSSIQHAEAESRSLKEEMHQIRQVHASELNELRAVNQAEMTKAIEYKSKFEALEVKLVDQKEEFNSLQEKFTKEFELVANKILEEKTNKFTDKNKENIDAILSPLKEKISEFQKKVEDSDEKSIARTAELGKHLEMLRALNQEITQETKSLTQALRGDSKTQGNWGEMHLEAILEKAGLQKGVHYTKETNLKTEDGANQRLDYIINMPDGKHLILDSKVSLTAYSQFNDSDDEASRESALKQHLLSVNGHIKLLGGKDYQNLYGINSPDYVLMFVANEPALTLALSEDPALFEKALDKNVVMVSTSTLLATLRTISYIWKQDLQNKNAEEIARQAAALYDKFVNFSEDLIKFGNQLRTATGTYESAMKKLSEGTGNLIRRTENLKKLGVNPSKSINSQLIDRSED